MQFLPGKQYIIDKYQDGTLNISVFHNTYIAEKGSAGALNEVSISRLSNLLSQPRAPTYKSFNYDFCILRKKEVNLLLPKKYKLPAELKLDYKLIDDLVLNNSVARTRKSIYGLVHNMNINVFGTLTFDQEIIDRKDLAVIKQKTGKWFNNLRRRFPEIQYVLVPEVHKKNIEKYGRCWHFHFAGYLPPDLLTFSGVRQKGRKVYNLLSWPFGRITNFTFADAPEKVANYLLKYVTKELCEVDFGKRRYLASNNISKPERVFHQFFNNLQDNRDDLCYQDFESIVKMFGSFDFQFSNDYYIELYGNDIKLQRFIFKEIKKDDKC